MIIYPQSVATGYSFIREGQILTSVSLEIDGKFITVALPLNAMFVIAKDGIKALK